MREWEKERENSIECWNLILSIEKMQKTMANEWHIVFIGISILDIHFWYFLCVNVKLCYVGAVAIVTWDLNMFFTSNQHVEPAAESRFLEQNKWMFALNRSHDSLSNAIPSRCLHECDTILSLRISLSLSLTVWLSSTYFSIPIISLSKPSPCAINASWIWWLYHIRFTWGNEEILMPINKWKRKCIIKPNKPRQLKVQINI